MDEGSQVVVPESFVALYRRPGHLRLTAPRDEIAERHGFCDDLAQMLTERALQLRFELGIDDADVVERVLQGLQAPEAGLSEAEAVWVVRRLAELLGWDDPRPDGAR